MRLGLPKQLLLDVARALLNGVSRHFLNRSTHIVRGAWCARAIAPPGKTF
jgi:hypothetical protein